MSGVFEPAPSAWFMVSESGALLVLKALGLALDNVLATRDESLDVSAPQVPVHHQTTWTSQALA